MNQYIVRKTEDVSEGETGPSPSFNPALSPSFAPAAEQQPRRLPVAKIVMEGQFAAWLVEEWHN